MATRNPAGGGGLSRTRRDRVRAGDAGCIRRTLTDPLGRLPATTAQLRGDTSMSNHCALCGWQFPEDYLEWQFFNEGRLQFLCRKCWLAATGNESTVVERKPAPHRE